MKVILFATSQFALPLFELCMADSSIKILACYSKSAKPAGRGMKQTLPIISQQALSHGIPSYQSDKLSAEDCENIITMKPDFLLVADYGVIIPDNIINSFATRIFNIHPSLLPKLRGAAPIQRALFSGLQQTGVSIIRLVKELDAGNIMLQQTYKISESDNALVLEEKLAKIGATMLINLLKSNPSLTTFLHETVQDESLATYAHKLKEEDYLLDFRKNARQLCNQIRATHPKGSFFSYQHNNAKLSRLKIIKADYLHAVALNEDLKIHKAQIADLPLNIINHENLNEQANFSITCADGSLLLPKIIQREGGKALSIEDFLRGWQY